MVATKQYGHVADASDQFGAGLRRDVIDCRTCCIAATDPQLDLDQFMMIEVAVKLGNQVWRHSGVADLNHRFEVVGQSTEVFLLFVVEFHDRIIGIAARMYR